MTNLFWGYAGASQLNGAYDQLYGQCRLTDVRVFSRILNDSEVFILYRAPWANDIVGAYNY
jgi:hypothetical protein